MAERLAYRRSVRCAGLLLAWGLLGCAGGGRPPPFLLPGHAGAPGAQAWLIAPPNFAAPVPELLAPGIDGLGSALAEWVGRSGRTTATIGIRELHAPYAELADGAPPEAVPPDAILAQLTAKLARSMDFDVAVFPDVLARTATYRSESARWDGVKRRVKIVRHEPRFQGRSTPSKDEVTFLNLRGSAAATSLQIRVFSRDGQKLFDGLAGLQLLHQYDVYYEDGWRWRAQVRNDLFTDPELLRETIALALSPYLVPGPVEAD